MLADDPPWADRPSETRGDASVPPTHAVLRTAEREVAERQVAERQVAERQVAERQVVDAESGTRWRVREVRASTSGPAGEAACLWFDAEHVARRVWRYPIAWRALAGPQLLALMEDGAPGPRSL